MCLIIKYKQREITFTLPQFRILSTLPRKKMKPEKRKLIKKKIKKIIRIIFIGGEYLSSPHNTNQYLLTKHQMYETTPKKEGKAPGSMLQFLLNEDQPQSEMTNFQLSQQEMIANDPPSHAQNQQLL